jgi:DNA polymerase-3 subunit delta
MGKSMLWSRALGRLYSVGKARIIEWRRASPSPLILVFGSEEYFYSSAIRRIRDELRTREPSLEIYEVEASEYLAGDLVNMISPSLFSDPKLVIIRGVERATDSLIDDAKVLEVSDLSDTTVLFQHSGTSSRGKALLDTIRSNDEAVEIACAKITDKEKAAFVQAHFMEAGRKYTQSAVRALVDAFGQDIPELAAACDQLLADSAEQIDETLVDRYFGGRIEATAFNVFDKAVEGQAGEALVLLRHALQTGDDPIKLIAGLASGLKRMATILNDSRANAASLGVGDWVFNKIRKSTNGWDDDGMIRAIQLLADADAAAKGAERQPEYRLEQLVMLIANRGRA